MRHGEPAWIEDGTPNFDPPLTARGRSQAEHVAARLGRSSRRIDELVVSPAQRARQTAAPIAEAIDRPPTVVDDLVECRLPDWAGHTPEQIAKAFVDARARSLEGWWDGLAGGESFRDFEARVRGATQKLLADRGVRTDGHAVHLDRDPGRIVVVAHGGTNSVLMAVLLGIPCVPWEWERIMLHHASIVSIRAVPLGGGHVFALRSHNDCEHLPREMRTR